MIAVQLSSRLSGWRSSIGRGAEVWPVSWGLVYWSGCFERTASGFIHLVRHRRNPRRFMQLSFRLRPDSSVVERGPEKAGVGGSIPSLATIFFFILLPSSAAREMQPD